MTVRVVDPSDLSRLARLEAECFPGDPWTEADLALYWGSGAIAGFLLELEGAPAAYALFQLLPGEVELLRIGVPPEERRRGTGARLLDAALRHLAAEGRPRCHLEVRDGNLAARRLYERLGFTVAGRRRGYYADGEDAVRYVREEPAAVG